MLGLEEMMSLRFFVVMGCPGPVLRSDFVDAPDASERHGDPQLQVERVEQVGQPLPAGTGHRPDPGAADQHAPRAERERLEHVDPAANAPVHEHLEPVAHRGNDAGQLGDRGSDAVELAAAVIGHDHAIRSRIGGGARIVGLEHALDEELAVPETAQPLDVLPGDGRIELRVDPGLVRVQVGRIGDDVRQAAEGVRLAEQAHVAHPAGPRADLPGLRELRPEAVAADHAVAGVAMTQARHRQVHREQQRRAAAVARAPEQALHDLAVPHHVELEP